MAPHLTLFRNIKNAPAGEIWAPIAGEMRPLTSLLPGLLDVEVQRPSVAFAEEMYALEVGMQPRPKWTRPPGEISLFTLTDDLLLSTDVPDIDSQRLPAVI